MIVARGLRWSQTFLQRAVSRSFVNGACSSREAVRNDRKSHIVWIDMEMTGLDHFCHIMEVACLITDKDLKVISEDFNLVIHQSKAELDTLSEWSREQHEKSGLLEECNASKISVKDAEQQLLDHLERYVPRGKCPIAGNSVYMDRLFLDRYMALVSNHLHYRNIDVSTISELYARWYGDMEQPKFPQHRALPDVKESIQQLRYYRSLIFKEPNT